MHNEVLLIGTARAIRINADLCPHIQPSQAFPVLKLLVLNFLEWLLRPYHIYIHNKSLLQTRPAQP